MQTITVHLAGALAGEGKRVCLIDFDAQGNSTSHFSQNPPGDIDPSHLEGLHDRKAASTLITTLNPSTLDDDSDPLKTDMPDPLAKPTAMNAFVDRTHMEIGDLYAHATFAHQDSCV